MKTVQGGAFRTLFEVLKDVIHDGLLEIDNTGMRLLRMDGARCCLVSMKLWADGFQEFFCNSPCTAGISLPYMFKLLRNAGTDDTITLYMCETETNELNITIQSAEKNSSTNFKLKLLEIDADIVHINDVQFDSVITLPSVYFQRLCRDASNIASHMTIQSRGNALVLSCRGELARQETVIGQAESCMSIVTTKESKDTYNLSYLQKFCKASQLCNILEMYIKEGFPLIMKYSVASLGEVKFCLAPQVDPDSLGPEDDDDVAPM
jgi:proliferating cell nuclear antigen